MSKTWWIMVIITALLGVWLGTRPMSLRLGQKWFGPKSTPVVVVAPMPDPAPSVPIVLCWGESPITRGSTNGQATECITVSAQMGFRSDGVVVWRPR
jgi:hypothetical protein